MMLTSSLWEPADPLAAPPQSGLSPELREALEKFIDEHKVILFMKGTRQFPQVRAHAPWLRMLSPSLRACRRQR
jgi:hypothetical protein